MDKVKSNVGDEKEILTKRIELLEQTNSELEQKLLTSAADKISLQTENQEKDEKLK